MGVRQYCKTWKRVGLVLDYLIIFFLSEVVVNTSATDKMTVDQFPLVQISA